VFLPEALKQCSDEQSLVALWGVDGAAFGWAPGDCFCFWIWFLFKKKENSEIPSWFLMSKFASNEISDLCMGCPRMKCKTGPTQPDLG
jgi:hypothetical protein